MKGFTLIEVMLSMVLVGIVAAATIPVYQSFQVRNNLHIGAETIAQTMRRAQALSIASAGDASWGVMSTTSSIVLFKGSSYSTREPEYDELFDLPTSITPVGLLEITFSKLFGAPHTTGTTTLHSSTNETKEININTKGRIQY